MHARLTTVLASILVVGCATASKQNDPDRNFNATNLTVDLVSNGQEVLDTVPAESAMERFEMLDPQGQLISYVAFTDTDIGALVFVDQKLHGTLSHHEAQAFYICRGHASSATSHWASEAADWAASLLANSKPETLVELEFSGKSTAQSIKEVADSPFLKRLKSLFSMGSSPFSIFSSLNSAKNELEENGQFDKVTKGLSLIRPGMSESSMVEVAKPEDVSFVRSGIVMAYPRHLIEYYTSEGVAKVIQRPSFHFLSKTNASLFYAPNTQWALCTPQHWKEALPEPPSPVNVASSKKPPL